MNCVNSSKIARAYGLNTTPMRQPFAGHLTFLGHALAADACPPARGIQNTEKDVATHRLKRTA